MMARNQSRLQTLILLAGSFAFAFLMGEMVHELGHLIAHRFFGYQTASIHLDPFGGSRIQGVEILSRKQMGFTTAAGPALNLFLGSLSSLLIWKRLHPNILPLILWGPVALVQEGVNLSAGLLSPGSDARWLAEWGIPSWLLIALGVFFIFLAIILISRILSEGLARSEIPYWGRFILIFFGLAFLVILRALVSIFRSPAAAVENLIPLAMAFILTLAISGGIGLRDGGKVSSDSEANNITWKHSLWAVGMGLGLLLLQIVLP